MPEPGPILAAGQAAIAAALAQVPAGDDGALVGIVEAGRQTVAIVTRIPGTDRWKAGAAVERKAGQVGASLYVGGSWKW